MFEKILYRSKTALSLPNSVKEADAVHLSWSAWHTQNVLTIQRCFNEKPDFEYYQSNLDNSKERNRNLDHFYLRLNVEFWTPSNLQTVSGSYIPFKFSQAICTELEATPFVTTDYYPQTYRSFELFSITLVSKPCQYKVKQDQIETVLS